MTDEIDIEEHDVMDNPMIRRIFPDLSVIKQEISKYYEEGLDTKPEPVSEAMIAQTQLAPESPCDVKEFLTYSHYPNIPSSPKENSRNLKNFIILGSKPNTLCTENLKQENVIKCVPKVTLQNISFFLKRSTTYCKDCMVLFPKNSQLEAHKKLIHAQRNKTFAVNKRKSVNKSISNKKYKCNICTTVLSTRGNLTKHLKNIHRITDKVIKIMKDNEESDDDTTRESLESDKSANVPNTGANACNTGANCFHCHKVFPTQKALVDHLYDILEPKKIDCKKCTMKFSNQENFEKHVLSIHNDNYAALNSFECYKCAIKFLSKDKLDQHNQLKHKPIRPKPEEIDDEIYIPPITYESSSESTEEEGNASENEEPTEEDELEILPKKRMKRTAIKKPDSPVESAKYTLRQNNGSKRSNTQIENKSETYRKNPNLNKESEIKLSVNKKSNNFYDQKTLNEKTYQCSICARYILTFKYYTRHMVRNHKMEKVNKVRKVLFDSECKFCWSKFCNMNSYNTHIIKLHEDKTTLDSRKLKMETSHTDIKAQSKNGDKNSFAFNSLLYKCNKCDICFLTAKSAINHSEHMEVLINWKCCICNRIFKKLDKLLHVKQHSNSHSFTVYNILCESDLNNILYLCLKCTIYFSEDSYVRHYSTCGVLTPDSVYCKICDCLIARVDFDSHDQIHANNKHITASDFTIVETDLIIDDSRNLDHSKNDKTIQSSVENSLKKMIHDKSRLYIAVCNICQCLISFVTNFGPSETSRKVHIEERCMHIKTHTCKVCGIVISAQTIKTHRKLHQDVKGLTIQNFSFFDLRSKKPIRPPIPVYPSCNICRVQFLSWNDVKEHECDGYDCLTCHVCQIKLSKEAFKFHMQFHEYSMEDSKELPITAQATSKTNNSMLTVNTTLCSSKIKRCSSKIKGFVESEFLYSCKICTITFDAYDPVIKHCQSHYDRRNAPVAKQSCQYCALNFDETYCKVHEEMHVRKKINVQSMKMINFDPFYFCLDNNLWMKHIFVSLSGDTIEKILGNSIYRFECRLKMEVFQAGPYNNTLYQCEKCLIFVDPRSLYVHAENSQCTTFRNYPCSACGLSFDTAKYKMDHEKIHEYTDISLKSCRLVRTNKKKDQIFHNMMFRSRNQFIMYQCRNCLVCVDKTQRHIHRCVFHNIVKCPHCGLLFSKQDTYNTHRNRHKGLEQFNTNHISVVLFGKKLYKGNQIITPSFGGKIYDYTFYKCTSCELCILTKDCIFKHKCVFDDSKCKCPKCDLYFLRQELTSHSLLHETDTEFEDSNLSIIIFDTRTDLKDPTHIVGNKENSSLQILDSTTNKKKNEDEPHNDITTERPDNSVKLFKCDCGLHFIDKANARKHYNNCNPNMKISKQLCSKCELLFTPAELFTHLLTHHGDKKQEYTFDISFIYTDDKKTPLYKCIKCNLHFVHESEVYDHFDNCNESGAGGEKCKKCGLRFKLSSYYKNKHRTVCEKKYEINVISEVKNIETSTKESIDDTNRLIDSIVTQKDMVLANEYTMTTDYLLKIDLSKYTNVIYKCNVCDVYYITDSAWRKHIHFLTVHDACNICGLNFSLQSLTRHKYIHHEKFNLKKDEFVIKSNNL